ncbi:MAG: hypothetical protein IME92_02015, partial [Proteobacteria bacterium]|nr:hypothetical protein [Pseudomonadota bacterium]
IAALEDHSILLENIAKQRDLTKQPLGQNPRVVYDREDGNNYPANKSQAYMNTVVDDQFQPTVQITEIRQKLQTARKDYFLRKLQKEEELGAAIEQATQDMRYLDGKLRDLNEQLDDNFIYATITGTVVGTKIAKTGNYYKKFDPVFTLQPIDNEFQVSFSLKKEDADKFIIGAPTIVSLGKDHMVPGHLIATTAAVLRKPNGKLEAVLDLKGNAKRNAEIILASGYSGAGVQRFSANITTGQVEIWKSIWEVFLKEPVPHL